MKKYFVFILLIIFLIFLYLNRSYAKFYDTIKEKSLVTPFTQHTLTIKNGDQQQTIKYIALGDSLSEGLGADSYQDSFPYLFAQKLSEKKQTQVNFINLAKIGATTQDLINTQLPKITNENPDYITLLIGTNDIHALTAPDIFQKNYSVILDNLTKTKAKIIVINIPYLGSNKILLPPYSELIGYRTQQFNKIIVQLVKETGVQYVDLYSQTKQAFESNIMLYSSDGFHPSSQGYRLWANIINAD